MSTSDENPWSREPFTEQRIVPLTYGGSVAVLRSRALIELRHYIPTDVPGVQTARNAWRLPIGVGGWLRSAVQAVLPAHLASGRRDGDSLDLREEMRQEPSACTAVSGGVFFTVERRFQSRGELIGDSRVFVRRWSAEDGAGPASPDSPIELTLLEALEFMSVLRSSEHLEPPAATKVVKRHVGASRRAGGSVVTAVAPSTSNARRD